MTRAPVDVTISKAPPAEVMIVRRTVVLFPSLCLILTSLNVGRTTFDTATFTDAEAKATEQEIAHCGNGVAPALSRSNGALASKRAGTLATDILHSAP